jgi:hypothetical protein
MNTYRPPLLIMVMPAAVEKSLSYQSLFIINGRGETRDGECALAA